MAGIIFAVALLSVGLGQLGTWLFGHPMGFVAIVPPLAATIAAGVAGATLVALYGVPALHLALARRELRRRAARPPSPALAPSPASPPPEPAATCPRRRAAL